MGRITVCAIIESLEDVYRVHRGDLRADQVRRIEVTDALIDTGATALSLPHGMIVQLGLVPLRTRQAMTTAGIVAVATFAAVKLTIEGRDCVCDVTEIDDACPVLIGKVPLELMDFLVDPGRRQVIGNPAHGGQQIMELL
jgi:predicted aspartyl protease